MAVEVKTIALSGNYMHCVFGGRFENLARIKENTRRIQDFCQEHKCTQALFDFRNISGNVGVLAQHLLGEHIAELLPRHSRIAVLTPAYMSSDATEHLETVVTNRAGHLKIFRELQAAVDWLNVE